MATRGGLVVPLTRTSAIPHSASQMRLTAGCWFIALVVAPVLKYSLRCGRVATSKGRVASVRHRSCRNAARLKMRPSGVARSRLPGAAGMRRAQSRELWRNGIAPPIFKTPGIGISTILRRKRPKSSANLRPATKLRPKSITKPILCRRSQMVAAQNRLRVVMRQ